MKRLATLLCFVFIALAFSSVNAQPIVDDFWIIVNPDGSYDGGGSGYNSGMWYEYPSGWINQWFYDHPLDFTRGKVIHIEIDLAVIDPALVSNICFVVNWSTPEWSYLGYGVDWPPVPDLVGEDEDLYIERVYLDTICPVPAEVTHLTYDYIIYDYNPEWVSIDVVGENFEITNGIIEHECVEKETDAQNETWGAVKSLYK